LKVARGDGKGRTSVEPRANEQQARDTWPGEGTSILRSVQCGRPSAWIPDTLAFAVDLQRTVDDERARRSANSRMSRNAVVALLIRALGQLRETNVTGT
jgi:hypothetical protein